MSFPSEPVPDPHSAWLKALEEPCSERCTLYMHIPFCKSRCLFCPFYMGAGSREKMSAYVSLLKRELETASERPRIASRKINAVYFGGGTPTDMEPEDFKTLLSVLRNSFNLTNDCEITVEGRLDGFSEDKMLACVDGGVNRFSIGVQTFDTEIRRSLGRSLDCQQTIAGLRKLVSLNQASVVIDLLYGLPGQTMDTWLEDQRIVSDEVNISGLDHYRMNVHPRLPLSRALEEGKIPPLPDENSIFELYMAGEEVMECLGALRLSIKHYAFEYRERNANNEISGWKNDCLPFGVHAGGRLGGFSFHQTDDLETYRQKVETGLKPIDRAGRLPRDHKVCSELAGQISRQRSINIEKAALLDPVYSEKIREKTSPLLLNWLDGYLLYPGHLGWLKLSGEAMFRHKNLASELMEKVAEAYENDKNQ